MQIVSVAVHVFLQRPFEQLFMDTDWNRYTVLTRIFCFSEITTITYEWRAGLLSKKVESHGRGNLIEGIEQYKSTE